MTGRLALIGLAFIVAGALVGIVYPWILLAAPPERALEILRYTASALSIVVGATLAAIGIALITGWGWRGSATSK